MPVLDAKALEVDPNGMTFLKSVLRPLVSSEVAQKEMPRIGRIRLHIPRRTREILARTA
jgi:hypothetical protein